MKSRSDSPKFSPCQLASTSSIDLCSVSTSNDEEVAHDLAPLLPQYLSTASPVRKPTSNRFSLQRLSIVSGTILGLFILATILRGAFHEEEPRKVEFYDKGSLARTRQFLSDPTTINQGRIPFPASYFTPLSTHSSLSPTLSELSSAPPGCRQEYASKGRLCKELQGRWSQSENKPKLDLIWTWTNGSQNSELEFTNRSRRAIKKVAYRLTGAQAVNHFREHDELRYSMRSALASVGSSSIATIHLVVGDTPPHAQSLPAEPELFSDETDCVSDLAEEGLPPREKSAQTPRWIDLSTIAFGQSSRIPPQLPTLRIHPHSEVFQIAAPTEETARTWQDSVLPSHNSLAIEAQLANIEFDSPTAVYLNDDFFLHGTLSVSDFESPLTGPIFRMQRDLLVGGVAPTVSQTDPDSEWKSLGTAAFLLDQRFGRRARPYLVHVAKTVSIPMLREVQMVFLDALTQTSEARYRGEGPIEVQMMHLLTHYTVEKHREALLYSYLVSRSNPSSAGFYSPSERSKIFWELAGSELDPTVFVSTIPVYAPSRSSLSTLSTDFETTGLPTPKGTEVKFSSADGYAYFELDYVSNSKGGWPSFGSKLGTRRGSIIRDENARSGDAGEDEGDNEPEKPICSIDLDSCFGTDFFDVGNDSPISAHHTLKRIAFEQPRCGDCLIVKLLGDSGEKGLEAFLPERTESESSKVTERVAAVGVVGTKWMEIEYEREPISNQTRRDFAVSLIQRYSYSIGESPAAFRSIRSGGEPLKALLESLSYKDETHRPPSFIALNDDIFTTRPAVLKDIDTKLRAWFEKTWPEPTEWESID